MVISVFKNGALTMENFDKILPLIFIVIWGLSFFFKANKGNEKTNSLNKDNRETKKISQPPLLNKLQNGLGSFFEELEQVQENIGKAQKSTSPLPTYKTLHKADPNDIDASAETEVLYIRDKKSDIIIKPDTAYSEKKRVKQHCFEGLSIKKLREAVVWSEILAKPIGLRNE